jgi:hypothetical protein
MKIMNYIPALPQSKIIPNRSIIQYLNIKDLNIRIPQIWIVSMACISGGLNHI